MMRYLHEFRNRPRFSSSSPWGPRPRRSAPECPTYMINICTYFELPAMQCIDRSLLTIFSYSIYNISSTSHTHFLRWSYGKQQQHVLLLQSRAKGSRFLNSWIQIRFYIERDPNPTKLLRNQQFFKNQYIPVVRIRSFSNRTQPHLIKT